MYNDEFDQFVFHDAIQRCGLKPRDADAKVSFYNSWIHTAIARVKYAEGPAEVRAAQHEIEQDIRNLESRHGWDQQMISAFRRRQQSALKLSLRSEDADFPAPAAPPN